MTHVITSPCLESKDQSCIEVCPVDCIYEAQRMLAIHPGECIDCGACIPECPVAAIVPEGDVPAPEQPYVEINAAILNGADAVDAAVAQLVGTTSNAGQGGEG